MFEQLTKDESRRKNTPYSRVPNQLAQCFDFLKSLCNSGNRAPERIRKSIKFSYKVGNFSKIISLTFFFFHYLQRVLYGAIHFQKTITNSIYIQLTTTANAVGKRSTIQQSKHATTVMWRPWTLYIYFNNNDVLSPENHTSLSKVPKISIYGIANCVILLITNAGNM